MRLLDHLVDHAGRQPREQRDALAQRRLESDLAAHGAFGDRGDVGLLADEIRQLVDAFLADHGGIHVGEKKLLAPSCRRLHHDIDRRVAASPRATASRRRVVVLAAGVKGMSTAMPGASHRARRRRERARRVARDASSNSGTVAAGDQGGDVRHGCVEPVTWSLRRSGAIG